MNLDTVDWTALTILVIFFLVVTVMGFTAVQGRRGRHTAGPMHTLDEWGLGDRGFGTLSSWFLLGGTIYTAYTFIAIPAAMFSTGAVSGFFAVPYTILTYPLMFIVMPRLWSVAHRRGYVTPADFVRGRYQSRSLALAVAVTGLMATLPYIALQLVGIQAVFEVIGLGSSNAFVNDLPLAASFTVLAAFTYFSGLRAPALIAVLKGVLLCLVVFVAFAYLPHKLGGFEAIFTSAGEKMAAVDPRTGQAAGVFVPGETGFWAYATLALGSAMALVVYPHTVTAALATRSRDVMRRNAALLPVFTLVLGLFALLGFFAVAARVRPTGLDGLPNPQLVVPELFATQFPSWFGGVAMATIAISALVPAAIMSIAAANLVSRNIYRELVNPDATARQEVRVSKAASFLVKFGALAFVLFLDRRFALDFQLLGGIWILQTFPAIVFGLYTRWFHPAALLAGWAAGMVYGTLTAYDIVSPRTGKHFGGSLAEIPLLGDGRLGYIALTACALNAVVSVAVTILLRAAGLSNGRDGTATGDYHADAGDPHVEPIRELTR
ncbi:sodium:solute symporter family protein [Microtetraspora sp. AC03309]|uniref:monocarboxylate uptake permease MctP n=1 Tax=Microtetraspora sp. AC03309 TaxID=2779376 RepID=UPI001E3E0C06|nr:sodium:solute symporter family protein [Microtetraspora sp. AC03309]MCC5575863.1 sodium:solute symporter family protein [Microtetraspora sp. AC03309]